METHPEFAAHGSFEHLKLGRYGMRHDPRTLRLASYVDYDTLLPTIPSKIDWTAAVKSWPMYGNDNLGDCTCAAAGHMIQAWTAGAGKPVTPLSQAILDAYWATGTGDTGRYEVDVLNYWRKHGIGGDHIAAYAYVDAKNIDHVRAAIYLFGGVYTGIALPVTAQRQTVWDVVGDGKTGDSQPGSWGGHAVPYNAYSRGRFKCVTWGSVLTLTTRFHKAYCDELYAPISKDWLSAVKKSPAGFSYWDLMRDLKALTAA